MTLYQTVYYEIVIEQRVNVKFGLQNATENLLKQKCCNDFVMVKNLYMSAVNVMVDLYTLRNY